MVREGGMPIGGYPTVLGHERLEIVREVGSRVKNKSLVPGDTALLPFHTCRQCRPCAEGRLGGCPHMTEVNFTNTARSRDSTNASKTPICLPDGSPVHGKFFGQFSMGKLAIVTEDSVVKIEAQAGDLPVLAPLSCGYLTGAGTILNVLNPRPTEKIAVTGMGAVGLAALAAAKAVGAKTLVAIDIFDTSSKKQFPLEQHIQ